ncbi:MAG: CidA/LrgA family protein [Clostridia bacterium]|nr:CidA/LrgA family protein [Clostridia bacterium]
MKYIKQFAIITFISLIGEALNHLIPLPVPASIYGVVILFCCLEFKIIPLSAVKETGLFLVSIMQIMFIPATVGLIDTWDVFAPNWLAYTVIIILSTFMVMLISGKVTQGIIRLGKKKEAKKNA